MSEENEDMRDSSEEEEEEEEEDDDEYEDEESNKDSVKTKHERLRFRNYKPRHPDLKPYAMESKAQQDVSADLSLQLAQLSEVKGEVFSFILSSLFYILFSPSSSSFFK